MANTFAINFEPDRQNFNNAFSALWKLSRVMKTAGWIYKAGSAGTVASSTIAAGSNGLSLPTSTIALASSAGFPTTGGSVLIGTLNTIVFYTGVSGNNLTGCTGGSGTLATSQTVTVRGDSSGVATNDPWGGSVNPMSDTFPSTTISQTSDNVALPTSTVNVISTTGFPSSGTFNINNIATNVTYTGKTATSFTGCSGGSGTMRMGHAATLMDLTAAWWCAEGPSTIKIGITAASTGVFIRGEVVFQATSGAIGELLGYVINAAGNSGWMVIMPQTGTFDGTHLITGATSGATVTATAYNLIRRQVVFAKNTTTTDGWIFYEVLSDTEIAGSSNTALFSDLAANAINCTTAVAPGNSSSGSNRFPLYGISCIGTSEGTGKSWFGNSAYFGKAQITALNATPSLGVTADGTFWCSLWNAEQTSNPNFAYKPIGLIRLDNTEPGDVDPFIFLCGYTTEVVYANAGRVSGTTSDTSTSWNSSYWGNSNQFSSTTPAKGYCARTTGTIGVGLDQYSGFNFSVTAHAPTSIYTAIMANEFSPAKIRNHPDSVTPNANPPPLIIEPLTVTSMTIGLSMRKGTCRWLGITTMGTYNDTYTSKKWLSLTTFGASSQAIPTVIIGPLDGTTIPVES